MTASVKEIEVLLSQLCLKLGFCLPPADVARLKNNPPSNPTEFARAVFEAEGMNPDHADLHLFRQVRQMVSEAFSNRDA